MTTETRRRILQNIHAGKDPYDGFTGSQLGGAIRSAQMVLRADWLAVENGRLVLTKSGLAEQSKGLCPHSGETFRDCKRTDLCDCLDYPEHEHYRDEV